jgi:hypothetical protein
MAIPPVARSPEGGVATRLVAKTRQQVALSRGERAYIKIQHTCHRGMGHIATDGARIKKLTTEA